MGLLNPLVNIIGNALDAAINPVGLGRLILYLLGPPERDELTAQHIDGAIEGGKMTEAVDGTIALGYVKKLRAWAKKLAESGK